LALWRRFRDISIERYVATYARFNIGFDGYSGESQVNTETIKRVETLLQEKGVYGENNGSWVIDFEKHGSKGLGLAVVRGRTGTTTYLLRDVAAVLDREQEYAFDKMIYVVSAEQDLYFRRVFRTLELLGRSDLVDHLTTHPDGLDADVLHKTHCVDLLRLMAQYPDVAATALRTLEPSTVLTYLFRLAHQLSSCYDVLQVVGADGGRDGMLARAALYEGARQVLENGMRLLGLSPVER
jgi:arginyl-tRNA synthetase